MILDGEVVFTFDDAAITMSRPFGLGAAPPGQLLAARMAGRGRGADLPGHVGHHHRHLPRRAARSGHRVVASAATIDGIIGLIGSEALLESLWWGFRPVLVATTAVAVITLALTVV